MEPLIKFNIDDFMNPHKELFEKYPGLYSCYLERYLELKPKYEFNSKTAHFKYDGNIIFQFNSMMDMEYFWMIFVGYEFHKYSENRLKSFDLEKAKQDEDKTPFKYVIGYPAGVGPICVLEGGLTVDIFLTEFDADLMQMFLNEYYKLDEDEKDMTPEQLKQYIIGEVMTAIENSRSKIKNDRNPPTVAFFLYIRHRTIFGSEETREFSSTEEYMAIELSYFFRYKEDLIDLIECLKLTKEDFKKGASTHFTYKGNRAGIDFADKDKEGTEILDKDLNKVLDYYFKPLIEALSYQVTFLPSIDILDKKDSSK